MRQAKKAATEECVTKPAIIVGDQGLILPESSGKRHRTRTLFIHVIGKGAGVFTNSQPSLVASCCFCSLEKVLGQKVVIQAVGSQP